MGRHSLLGASLNFFEPLCLLCLLGKLLLMPLKATDHVSTHVTMQEREVFRTDVRSYSFDQGLRGCCEHHAPLGQESGAL